MTDTLEAISALCLTERTFLAGTYTSLNFDVYDSNGSAVDVSSATFNWYLSPYGQPSVVSLFKTGVSRAGDGYSNRFTVYLTSEDTAALYGKFVQQPVISFSTGYEFRLKQGYVNILPASSNMTASAYITYTEQVDLLINTLSASVVDLNNAVDILTADLATTSASVTNLMNEYYIVSASSVNLSNEKILSSGAGIQTGIVGNQFVVQHGDTSSQADIINSSASVIQSLDFDDYGHVTSASSKWLTLDNIGSASNTTTNDATTSAHGLLPKLSDNAYDFLNGDGSWISHGATIVYLNANQSCASATWTAVSFTTAQENSLGAWSSASPTRLTAPATGVYLVTGGTIIAANATGVRNTVIKRNGSYYANGTAGAAFATVDWHGVVAEMYPLNSGDYVELMVYQTNTAALNILGASWNGSNHTQFSMVRLY